MRSRFIFRFRKNKVGCFPYIPSVFSLYFLIVLIEYWNTEDKYIRYDDTFVAHISFDHVIHKWLHTHTHTHMKKGTKKKHSLFISILIKKNRFIYIHIYIHLNCGWAIKTSVLYFYKQYSNLSIIHT